MATVRELVTKLGFKVDEGDINKAEGRVKKMSMGMKLAITGAVAGVFALGKSAIGAAADMETLNTQFEVMLGSSEAAAKMMSDLRAFSIKTPYETEDLARSATTLLQFGIESDKVMGTLRMLGDVAGSNREKFQSLNLVYGQIMSTGRLMGQDLLQLINQGFNPLQVISEQTGKSVGQLKDEMSKGLISAEMVTEAFRIATAEGGMFFQNMEKQSLTLTGLLSTMKGAFKEVLVDIGNALLPLMKELVGVLTTLAKGPLKELIGSVTKLLIPVLKIFSEILEPLIEALLPLFNKLAEIFKPLIEIIMAVLLPAIEMLNPVIAFLGQILDAVGIILNGLLPVFEMLGEILRALMPILAPILELFGMLIKILATVLTPIIMVLAMGILYLVKVVVWLLTPLKWLANALILYIKIWQGIYKLIWKGLLYLWGLYKKYIAWLWGVFGDAIDWVLEQFSWVGDAFTWLGEVLALYLSPIIRSIGDTFTWLGEVISDVIDWIGDKVNWIAELLGLTTKPEKIPEGQLEVKMPSASEAMKTTSGSSKQTSINMQNQFNISGMGAGKRGAKKTMEEAARSIFSLELQKLVINAGL